METKAIAKVNDVTIQMIYLESGIKLVPLKPICEALGIDYDNQDIAEDEFLFSNMKLLQVVKSDGKTSPTVCIRLKYVFGWLFFIKAKMEDNDKNKNNFMLCYDIFISNVATSAIF